MTDRLFFCQSCRGLATHFFRMDYYQCGKEHRPMKGRGHGYRLCIECIGLWERYGRSGFVRRIGEDGAPA